ncbi:MAG: lysostaphin resistance A-like protein [Cyanobium sp.]
MNVSPTPQPRQSAGWITGLALLSLVLSGLLWFSGLVDSLQRPSVGNALELRQRQLTALAAPALPPNLRQTLAGEQPLAALRLELQKQLVDSPVPPPLDQQLQLALLELQGGQAQAGRQGLLKLNQQVPPEQRRLLDALLTPDPSTSESSLQVLLAGWAPSPLTRELVCQRLGGAENSCGDSSAQRGAVMRLVGTSLAPVLLLVIGTVLLVRQLWLRWRGKGHATSPLAGPPLTLSEATLLIAGGFVVLGELVVPLLLAPLLQGLLNPLNLQPALQQGLLVMGLYLGLMAVPLLMLWSQLRPHGVAPAGGWLQWHWQPLGSALRRALAQVLMVLPAVALVGWLLERLVGDPGGSNPLLELVLNSANPLALLCFAFTALVLAPLFEETLFRGVLLPVLAQRWGGLAAVLISALVFGIAHLSLGELPPLFVLGLGLGWLRLQSGRLGASVLMHSMWNTFTFANLLLLAG